jgi:hypothetical protein
MTDSYLVIAGMFTIIGYGVMLLSLSAAPDTKKNVCQMAENEIEQKTAVPRFYWNFP